jgi:hypothetical protein
MNPALGKTKTGEPWDIKPYGIGTYAVTCGEDTHIQSEYSLKKMDWITRAVDAHAGKSPMPSQETPIMVSPEFWRRAMTAIHGNLTSTHDLVRAGEFKFMGYTIKKS